MALANGMALKKQQTFIFSNFHTKPINIWSRQITSKCATYVSIFALNSDKKNINILFFLFFRMVYYFDVQLVHAFIFIIPCVLISLFKIWTKLVAKSQAEIISRQLNRELVKLV